MNRIDERIKYRIEQRKKVLACFITAGFPTINSTPQLVLELEKAGADIVEIGMPFSDPLADGPVIQRSSQIALDQGINLDTIFEYIKKIRETSNVPIVLMGYLNPIMKYGVDKFLQTAKSVGTDGIILPELPYEECYRFKPRINEAKLANIMLVAPTTPLTRVVEIDKITTGFLYCVSVTGVTGANIGSTSKKYIKNVKKVVTKNPVLVGFGIKTPQDAKEISKYSDGVIIGSAIIREIMQGKTFQEVGNFIKEIRKGLDL